MNPWDGLFRSDQGSKNQHDLAMRILRKQGRPLLLVPPESRLAERCLDLYPAQSAKARMAKQLLRTFWKVGAFVNTEPGKLGFDSEGAFPKYIASLAGRTAGELSQFGLLAGNPAGGTQRFLILIFDAGARPVSVVKAGLSSAARVLVRAESDFLTKAPGNVLGLPRFISKFENPSLDAFATQYCAGDSPRRADATQIAAILTSWLDTTQQRPLTSFPEIVAAQKLLTDRSNAKAVSSVSTSIQHGDFAPWNIKVSADGTWTVLDWERGNLHGIPAWDWFHYEIQTGILVHRSSTEKLLERIKWLVTSEPFKQYAQQAGIAGLEKALLSAYLLNLVEIIKPAEGLTESRALLEALPGHTF